MPRQKRTEARSASSAAELPELTNHQLAFVRAILEGKNASDAYRAAYDTRNWTDEAIWVEASRTRHHPNVSLWLSAARQANMDTAKLTIDSHMSELARLRDIAIDTGNVGAAVLAETNRGKASGLYTDRVEDVTRRPETANGLYVQLLKHSPEIAAAFARAAGLDVVVDDTNGSRDGTNAHVTH